jgi:hypothetical protein
VRPLNRSSPKATLDNFLNLGATYHSDVCIFPDDYETEENIPKHLKKPNTLGEIPVRTYRTLELIPKFMKPKKNIRKHSMRQEVVGETLARMEPMPVQTPMTMTPRKNTSRLLKKPKTPVAE